VTIGFYLVVYKTKCSLFNHQYKEELVGQ